MRERRRGRSGTRVWTVAVLALVGSVGVVTGSVAQQADRPAVVPPPELIVLPVMDEVKLTVGARQRFSVTVIAVGAAYRWTLDGEVVSTEPRWTYEPGPADIGTHEVNITVLMGATASRQRWGVVVEASPAPTVREAAPVDSVVRVPAGETVSFRFVVEPGVETETIDVVWTVDGEKVGTGSSERVEAIEGEVHRVRAVASSDRGALLVREWRLEAVSDGGVAAIAEPRLGAVEPDKDLAALIRQPSEAQRHAARAKPSTTQPRPTSTTSVPPPAKVVTTTLAPTRAAVVTTSTAPKRVAAVTSTTARPRVAVVTTTTAPKRVAAVTSTTVRARVAVVTTTTAPKRVAAVTSTTARPRAAVVTTTTRPTRAATPPTTVPPRVRPAAPTEVAALPPGLEPIPPARSPRGAASSGSITRDEVTALLGRYEKAYTSRDLETLRAIGQVTSDRQADALGRYFETVDGLQVTVEVLEIDLAGARPTVRFRRRDQFRDPAGRVVAKETPPIEKVIVRTPSGLKFAPRS